MHYLVLGLHYAYPLHKCGFSRSLEQFWSYVILMPLLSDDPDICSAEIKHGHPFMRLMMYIELHLLL